MGRMGRGGGVGEGRVGLQNGRCKRPRRKGCFVIQDDRGGIGEGDKKMKFNKTGIKGEIKIRG